MGRFPARLLKQQNHEKYQKSVGHSPGTGCQLHVGAKLSIPRSVKKVSGEGVLHTLDVPPTPSIRGA